MIYGHYCNTCNRYWGHPDCVVEDDDAYLWPGWEKDELVSCPGCRLSTDIYKGWEYKDPSPRASHTKDGWWE